jgi:hypothetical protein
MKLNLIADSSGRQLERALGRAFRIGFDDAKKLKKRGSQVRALRTGEEISKELTVQCRKDHITFLRSAYGAGLFQGDMVLRSEKR